MRRRAHNLDGGFCPHCGRSVAALADSEYRVLAAVAALEADFVSERRIPVQASVSPSLGRPGAKAGPSYVVRTKEIEDRSGLDHSTCIQAIVSVRELGYLETRKAYGRRHDLHRLSGRTRGDVDLMEEITAWRSRLRVPTRHLTAATLNAERTT